MKGVKGLFLTVLLLWMVGCGGFDMAVVDELTEVEELPDPFIMNDGRRVETRQDWLRRSGPWQWMIKMPSGGRTIRNLEKGHILFILLITMTALIALLRRDMSLTLPILLPEGR